MYARIIIKTTLEVITAKYIHYLDFFCYTSIVIFGSMYL